MATMKLESNNDNKITRRITRLDKLTDVIAKRTKARYAVSQMITKEKIFD